MRVNWEPGMNRAEEARNLQTKSESKRQLQQAAEQFEALFLNQLLAEMRKTVPESDLMGDRRAEKMFESMLDEEVTNSMANAKSVGLSQMIVKQLQSFVEDEEDR